MSNEEHWYEQIANNLSRIATALESISLSRIETALESMTAPRTAASDGSPTPVGSGETARARLWPAQWIPSLIKCWPITRRCAPQAIYDAARDALSRIVAKEGWTADTAWAWLVDRARAYGASDEGKSQYCRLPRTWLEQGGYDEPNERWTRSQPEPDPEPF